MIQLEFPPFRQWFAAGVAAIRQRRRPFGPVAEPLPDLRTKDAVKSRSKDQIQTIVERVAEVSGVAAADLFLRQRESETVARARTLAMAACCSVGVPLCHVARAFGRQWQTVYSAEKQAARRYRNSSVFRRQWDTITRGMNENEN